MLDRPDRIILGTQVVICVLMVAAAAFGGFPNAVPVLFLAGALGAANAGFDLMRTFGSALLGGVIAASVALAGIPFVTCSSSRFDTVFACTGDQPTRHLTGTVIVAALSGASLVLARVAAHARQAERLATIERRIAEIQRELATGAMGAAGATGGGRTVRRRRPDQPVDESEAVPENRPS